MTKEKDLKYIQEFSKINITQICKDLGVSRSNVMTGRSSSDTTKAVKEEIQRRLATLNE